MCSQRANMPDLTPRIAPTSLSTLVWHGLRRWVCLETFDTLGLSDVRDDSIHVVLCQARNRRHVAEPKVVGGDTDECGERESPVAMMVRVIHDREVGRAEVCSSKIGTVTHGAVRLVQHISLGHNCGVLHGDTEFALSRHRVSGIRAATRHDYKHNSKYRSADGERHRVAFHAVGRFDTVLIVSPSVGSHSQNHTPPPMGWGMTCCMTNHVDHTEARAMVVHSDTLNRRPIQACSCCRLCRHEHIGDETDGHDAEHVTHDVARGVANTLNLDIVFSQVLPADKDAYVSRLQEEGDRVGMVGDGVNDAPALVRSDIGIAIGSGTDVAVQSADLVLVKSGPWDIVKILRLSSASYRKQLQNIW